MASVDAIDFAGGIRAQHWLTIPIDSDPNKSRSDWQGATYAVDPRNGNGFLYQMQVSRTGPGDVEDIWVHVFQVVGNRAVYKFSTLVKRAGHVQSLHVRISIHGKHWAWMGCENYVKNKTKGTSVWRIALRRGRVKLGSSGECQRIITGPGSPQVVGCKDGAGKTNFTVVLRWPEKYTEVYAWYDENVLRKHRSKTVKPRATASVRVVREGGTYQSSCATGNFRTAAKVGKIYRINGSTDQRSTVRRFAVAGKVAILSRLKLSGRAREAVWDVTNYAPAEARPVTSEEGEAVFHGPDSIVFGKRANSVRRRKVFYARIFKKTPVA